jgi:predicted transposase YbfD/YdcC
MSVTLFNTKFNDNRKNKGRIYSFKGLMQIIIHGLSLNLSSVASIHRVLLVVYTKHRLKKIGFIKFPSVTTLQRLVIRLDIDFNKNPSDIKEKLLHLDGKSICGSRNEEGNFCHIVNLYNGDDKTLIASQITPSTSKIGGERAASKEILEKINIEGAIITGDAAFSSGDFPSKIIEKKAHFFLKIKDNTKILKDTMRVRLGQHIHIRGEKYLETDLSSGKVYEREIIALPTASLYSVLPAGLQSAQRFGMIQNRITDKKTKEVTVKEHFFITSLTEEEADSKRLLEIHLSHWRVENDLHRAKDMFLGEDKKTIRSAKKGENMATLLSNAVSILYKINQSIVQAIDAIRTNHSLFINTLCNFLL